MKAYVVTGCAGFIGSHLAETLLARGDSVIGIDSFSDYYAYQIKEANIVTCLKNVNFHLIRTDISDVPLDDLCSGAAGIFHLAAQPGVRGSWGSSFDVYVKDNIRATQRVLEAAAKARIRVVFASSSSVYGNATAYPTSEEVRPRPISPYGVTKLACEELAAAYSSSVQLEATALRYFTVYGPRQRPDMAFARIVKALLEGDEFTVFGNGLQSRDFTYVADAVTATLLAMEKSKPGMTYNVGGGSEASLLEAIQILEAASGKRLRTKVAEPAIGDVVRTSADTQRVRSDLGWASQTSLAEGLRTQLRWASQNSRRTAAKDAAPAR
jgi:UDP-glucuronate 4-epimerase